MRSAILMILILLMTLVCTPPAKAQDPADPEAIEQEMEQAREQLREAARRIAELNALLHEEEFREPVVRMMHRVRGPRLGVSIGPSTEPAGVRVERVMPDSAADKAGLQVADVIIAVKNEPLEGDDGPSRLARAIRAHGSEVPIPLTVMRDGERLEMEVPLAPPMAPMPPRVMPEVRVPDPAMRRDLEQHAHRARALAGVAVDWMRVRLAPMNQDLAAYFGTAEGVLVLSVPEDSELPLVAGDVILRVGETAVAAPRDMIRALRDARGGDSVVMEILRQGEVQTVEARLPGETLSFLFAPGH